MTYLSQISFDDRDYEIVLDRNLNDNRTIKISARKKGEIEFLPIIQMIVDEFALIKDERAKVVPTFMQIDLVNSEMIVFSEDGQVEKRRFVLTDDRGQRIQDPLRKFIASEKTPQQEITTKLA